MSNERSYDYFWNSNNDRYYDADSFADWLKPFFVNGVFEGQLQVTANDDMSVTVATGYGYINGKHRHFIEETTLDLENASGTLDRIDAVMLRRDDTERMISLVIEKGGNAAEPTPPDPTREGAIYDLKLAEIYIAAGTVKVTQDLITDTRMNSDVCGWVAAAVEQIDFTQIQAQFDAYFANYKQNIKDQYADYLASIENYEAQAKTAYDLMNEAFEAYKKEQQEAFEAWIAERESRFETWSSEQQETFAGWKEQQETDFSAWKQQEESDFADWYATSTADWTDEFKSWFENVKTNLSEDAAGNLQNEIDALTNIIYTGEVPANLVDSDGGNLVDSSGNQLIAFWTLKTSETCSC